MWSDSVDFCRSSASVERSEATEWPKAANLRGFASLRGGLASLRGGFASNRVIIRPQQLPLALRLPNPLITRTLVEN